VDPGGEVFGIDDAIIILAMAYFGGMQANFFTADNPMNPGDWNWKSANTYTGIVSGAVAGASMVGVMPVWLPKLDGMIPRGLFQAGVNVGINGLVNIINGDKFMDNWESAAISGFINGAITGYELAKANGTNYWWGNEVAYNRNQWSLYNVDKPDYVIDFNIPNVGSNLDNDCMPTTFLEIESKRGGIRTYDNFIKITGYQENVGVKIEIGEYEELIKSTFNNVQTLSRNDYYKLFDTKFMQAAADNGQVFSVYFKGHVDNVRSLQVYTRAPYKNKLTFRQSKYNFTLSGKGVTVLNVFWFY